MNMKLLAAILACVITSSAFAQTKYRMPYPEPIAQTDGNGQNNKLLSEAKFGYYNLTKVDGKFVLIIDYQYDEANQFSRITGYATAKMGGLWGIINVDSAPLVPFIYDAIDGPNELGMYKIKLNGKWGLLDKSGYQTVTCKYDNMDDLFDGWYSVSEGDNWGYLHWSGVYAPTYSDYEKKKANLD